MDMLNRLLLLFYSLIFAVLSAVAVAFTLGAGTGRERVVTDWIGQLNHNPDVRWPVLMISIVVFIASLRLIWYSFQRKGEAPGVDRLTEIGHIRISLKTLENLAEKAARRVRGIRDLTARVRHDGNHSSIGIGLKLTVDGDTPIQALSEELQQTVKNHIEEIAGVAVNQISVYISDTVQPDRSRVRVE
ncbi:alkaline shock response membrane anchor protein AmaP [Paludifilum halophilum]|uniref:Alkaline shock response membrane anchor protein AmaP n=1 Tax=Paludifilum halophilum TaxID=1642702 RepID=A0A235BC10_9BACL|nr:alkaline shock response membrane anchor protein AmaP [Paludifilum halophilum]OYD09830.1 hypothetical protein CHM34_02240 [Paludifilum halophilum]